MFGGEKTQFLLQELFLLSSTSLDMQAIPNCTLMETDL